MDVCNGVLELCGIGVEWWIPPSPNALETMSKSLDVIQGFLRRATFLVEPLAMRPCLPASMQRFNHSLRLKITYPKSRLYATAAAPDIYDVVCVGGGPAGLSLVNALRSREATRNLRLALVEVQDLKKAREWRNTAANASYSNRCSSLTPASVKFLDDIGVWRHMQHSRVRPYESMKVWDGVSGARISFDWPGVSGSTRNIQRTSETIAHMTENNNLISALLAKEEEIGGIKLFDKSRVEAIKLGEDTKSFDMQSWPILELSDGSKIAARLLVGADGPNSLVRQFAGISSRGWSYDRHGVVATIKVNDDRFGNLSKSVAYQRFLPTGPVAHLPLPDGNASLVWSTTPSNAALLKSLSEEDMIAMVNAAFRLSAVDLEYMHTINKGQKEEVDWRLQHGSFDSNIVPPNVTGVVPGTVASFPLRLNHIETYIGERVALVGDAAHTIHPLAGQGLNQGQADVEALVATIEAAVRHGQDIGSQISLEPFNAKRYAANNMLMGVVDKLHKLYSVSSGPIVTLRSLGLSAVDALGPFKGFLMQQAAGSSSSSIS